MRDLNRRSFVGATLAALPLAVLGEAGRFSTAASALVEPVPSGAGLSEAALGTAEQVEAARAAGTAVKAALVPNGEDREGVHHSIGISTTDFKVTTKDSGGALFLFEHHNHTKKGGPPRHLHHNEDEWFYVIEEPTSSRPGRALPSWARGFDSWPAKSAACLGVRWRHAGQVTDCFCSCESIWTRYFSGTTQSN